jgi:hypothetical protein
LRAKITAMFDQIQLLNGPGRHPKERDDFTPWEHTGQSPIDWMAENLDHYILSKEKIIESGIPIKGVNISARPGVYFLMRDNEIIYVGISKQIDRRVWQHKDKLMPFNRVAWLTWIPEMYLASVEAYYIYEFRPKLNNKYPSLCSCLCEYAERYPEKAKLKAFYREYLTPNEICWFDTKLPV